SRGRVMPLYLVVTQFQSVGRPGNKDEPVVGQGRNAELKSWLGMTARRLHTDPSLPVARRIRPERKDFTPVQGPDGTATARLYSPSRGPSRLDLRAARTESSPVQLAPAAAMDLLSEAVVSSIRIDGITHHRQT